MLCNYNLNKYIHIFILVTLICLAHGNGNFLKARSRDFGAHRNTDSNKLVKGEGGTSNVEDGGSVRAVGEVFVPKTFPLSSQEPSCEQLRAMWIFSKRQSRGAEITNEIPTYRDPFTYNVWEPLYSNSRMLSSMRMGLKERVRSPVFGRVVSREPIIPQRVPFEQRQRHVDGIPNGPGPSQIRSYSPEGRPTPNVGAPLPSPRRSSKNRYVGVPNSSVANVANVGGTQNSVAVQGSFQKLKELIWTERAKELTQQRRAEELAARAAVLKEIANGQNTQASYKPQFSSQTDSLVMDENRSPDIQYVNDGRMSIANGQQQTLESNNKHVYRSSDPRASTRRIGSSYGSHTGGPRRKEAIFSGNAAAASQTVGAVARIKIPGTDMNPGDLTERDQSVIGIPRTYPMRQSHFRERNRSLLKQYSPSEYFQRNTRNWKNLQLGTETVFPKVQQDSNDKLKPIEYDLKPSVSGLLYLSNDRSDGGEITSLLPQNPRPQQYEYDFYDYNGY